MILACIASACLIVATLLFRLAVFIARIFIKKSLLASLIIYLGFGVFSLILVTAYLSGAAMAASQITFMFNKENTDQFLVRRYGDNFIFKSVDRKTRRQGDDIHIFKIGDGKSLDMRSSSIGKMYSDCTSNLCSNFIDSYRNWNEKLAGYFRSVDSPPLQKDNSSSR